MEKIKRKKLPISVTIGFILIFIGLVAMIIQTIQPNDSIKELAALLAFSTVLGVFVPQIPFFIIKEPTKESIICIILLIISGTPIFVLLLYSFYDCFIGIPIFDQTIYGFISFISRLFVYTVEYFYIIIPAIIIYVCSLLKLLSIKTSK